MKEKSKIIVTGGLGFLGQHIVSALSSNFPDKKILVLSRSPRKLWVFDALPKNVEIITELQLEDISKYHKLFDSGDIVVHSAATVSYKKKDKRKIYSSNFEVTKKILKICSEKKVRKVILISSISAIALNPSKDTDETLYPPNTVVAHDYYGHSKLLSELELAMYSRKFDYIILNPGLILGPGSSHLKKLVRTVAFSPIIPSLKSMNSFVDARDVARAVVLAIKSKSSGERFIVSTQNMTNEKFITILAKLLGRNKIVVYVPAWLLRAADFLVYLLGDLYPFTKTPGSLLINKSYTSEKIRKELGWKPIFTVKNSLMDTIRWSRNENWK